MHKLPHLFKSRHGVFYLRLARGGQEVKRSLRTKDFRQARLLALAFNLELAMKTPDDKPKAADFNVDAESLKRLDVIFPDGTQVKDINSDDDVRRAKELFGDRFAAAVPAPPSFDLPAFSPSVAAAIAAQKAAQETKREAKPFADVVKLYKKEKALDNTARTIAAKERAFADFEKRIGSLPPTQDNIKGVVEIKFPPQTKDPEQDDDYARIAGSPNKVATMGPGDCDCSDDDGGESPVRALSEALSGLGRSLRQMMGQGPASPPGFGGLPMPPAPIPVP
nr:hypothetical protein [Paraburkholderia kururiensis]